MRAFYKVSSWVFSFLVCPYLAQATIYKVEDYQDKNSFNVRGVSACDNAELWNENTCNVSKHSYLPNKILCNRMYYSTQCECLEGYIRIDSNNSIQVARDHFIFNEEFGEMKRENQTAPEFYCIPEPTGCRDNDYVMAKDTASEFVHSGYGASVNGDKLNITYANAITVQNNDNNPVYTLTIGNNRHFYCAPNFPNAYSISLNDPAVDNANVSFNSLNCSNCHATQNNDTIGGKLTGVSLHYYNGCDNGWTLYNEQAQDCGSATADAGDRFAYINAFGYFYKGFCGKCIGCGNSYDPTTQTLGGSLGDSEVAAGAFSERNCKLSCAPGYTNIALYGGQSRHNRSGTCTGNSQDCVSSSQYANAGHFVFTYKTLDRTINGMDYHLVCAKPTGCNVEAGYISGCETSCWKSFFYKENN